MTTHITHIDIDMGRHARPHARESSRNAASPSSTCWRRIPSRCPPATTARRPLAPIT